MKKLKQLSLVGLLLYSTTTFIGCKKKDNTPPTTTTSTTTTAKTIGQSYGGGIIFYVDGTGLHGLIATTSDQGSDGWQCDTIQHCSSLISGANGTALGTGAQNTIDIVNGYSGSCAARTCEQLTFGGYSDWFLPSKDELYLLWQQRNVVGGFTANYYWSSTQKDFDYAWDIYFSDSGNGDQNPNFKSSGLHFRAIRAF